MKISRTRLKEIIKGVMTEENEYQAFFQKALDKAGKSIPSMSDEEKKAFFDKIDAAWNGKGEKNEELIGGQKKLDVDKDGDVYNTMSNYWHDLSNQLLDIFEMLGIRDERYMKPMYDFKFNKRSLDNVTIV